jgi:hypothetical protein
MDRTKWLKTKNTILIAIGILVLLPGCLYAVRVDGPYEGRVIDATGEPIEGVVVLGVWDTETPSPAGAISRYYDAAETVTDNKGEFTIAGKGLSANLDFSVLIFKAGYEYIIQGP